MTLEQIREKTNVSRAAVDQTIKMGIRRLRCNTRTKKLGIELGMWNPEIPLDASRVK
jgi:DNA-directed RNA polymerase sigma subunit (sigma70/sigma32)